MSGRDPQPTPTEEARAAALDRAAVVVAAAVGLLAALVLVLGWWGGVTALRNVGLGLAPMKPNTALALGLAALALWLDRAPDGRRRPRAQGVAAGVVTAMGGLHLFQHATGWDLGVNHLLARVDDGSPHPGRVSLATSTSLLSLGVALGLRRQGGRTPAWVSLLARVPAAVGFFAVLGYAYEVRALYALRPFDTTALHTALALFALGAAVALTFDDPLRRLLVSDGAGGELARRVLPAALLVPPLTGWLRLLGQRVGWYGTEVGLTLFASANVITFAALTVVTARALQRQHEQLAEREENLEITLQSIGDAVIATDAAGRISRMNPVAEALTGWSARDAVGRPLREVFRIMHEDTGEEVESPVDRVLRDGVVVGLANHTALRRRGGGDVPIADSGAPIRDRSGTIRGVVLVFRDQTEERRAQETRERLAHLASSGLFGVVVTRRDGSVEEANDELLRILGRSRDELGRGEISFRDHIPPEGVDAARAMSAALDLDGVASVREMHYLRSDGARIPVLVGAARLDTGRLIGIALDITAQRDDQRARLSAERTLAERDAQLEQAQRMESIGRLAGGVAHDFNNILAVILGYTKLLEEELGAAHPDLREIRTAGHRATELTRQLLAFGRRQVLEPKAVDLHETVSRMGEMLRRVLGEDIELVVHPAPWTHRVLVDPLQIEQVLMNLIVNARDAMPRGGRISIELADVEIGDPPPHAEMSMGPHVVLSVTDTGEGIPAEVLPRVFEPFFTTKGVGKGTGLGLATSFGIVKQSGGHITVESQPGLGATFRVFLPRAPADALPSAAPAPPEHATVGAGTILLAEDDEQVRRVTQRVLERAGYRVLAAGGGAEALAMSAAHPGAVDLLLTDIVMPKMGGRELAEQILGSRPDTPVLYMSGYTDDRIVHHGVETAQVDLLRKPASPSALLAKVREVISRRS